MSEMIGRVARAIRDKGATCDWCMDPMPPDCCCYEGARAAIEAMYPATFAMIEAGVPELQRNSLAGAFHAMIDAALRD